MKITGYRFGSISIDGKGYNKDLKIIKGVIYPEWWRDQGHLLQVKDIEDVLAARPHTLIVGTGASGLMKLAPDVKETLASKGIRTEALPSELAVQRFNELVDMEGLDAVALAIHLTC